MDKYIVVRVKDADRNADFPAIEKPWSTNLGIVRKAIHEVGESRGIRIADMPTHTLNADYHPSFFTTKESNDIAMIFETALRRAKVWRDQNL